MVVKDLLDVAGIATGAGNPDWLAAAAPAAATAPAVQRLLDAGVDLVGRSHTDELAFSLSGTNVHYGTPANPAAPGRIPGGSSSGSASAVAAGLADLGVGTDTGGSIRVPASYCGLFGWRPTHGRVPIEGCVPLAPTFDTVGLLARDGETLARGAHALLTSTPEAPPRRLLVATDLVALADADVAARITAAAAHLAAALGATVDEVTIADGAHDEWFAAFRARQMYEAWQCHGEWITRERPHFGPGIAARFAAASRADEGAARAADATRALVRSLLRELLDERTALVVPAAATVAPPPDLAEPAKTDLRARTMTITCVAGLAGAPAVVIPTPRRADDLPVGLCLVGRPGDDEVLLAAASTTPTP
jgi:Asp-tRNA(Asn)/Glu-tRNA(Gln) amidotransferase A subunit family amidase